MRKKRLFTSVILMTACLTLASCKINKKKITTTETGTTPITTGTDPVTTPSPTDPTTVTTGTIPTTTGQIIPDYEVVEAYKLNPDYSGQGSDSQEELETIAPVYNPEVEEEVYGLKYGTGFVLTDGEVNVTSVSGTNEAIYIEYNAVADATNYVVEIKNSSETTYEALNNLDELYNNNLYTRISGTKVRTDIFGLPSGEYDLKITPVISNQLSTRAATVCRCSVEEYDRSGYAHFNYTSGVGAYNDDGTLKENAIVLYVTDENKNTVTLSYGSKSVAGIGNILNTAGKKCGEAGHEDECKKVSSGKTYYGKGNDNDGILQTLSENNIPLVIRIVGCVSDSGIGEPGSFDAMSESLIDGLTSYNSNDYGGSEGDNGHMARMKSAKNVTIEGVGSDAIIDGWGIHFMCESANSSYGKSFEVRNIAFMNTPEDALGMEGVQDGSTLTASVERCWIHNNCFFKPNILNPAEGDKSEGDGACDFKRGRYYTLSYNYFEYCHKTNLLGSSDSSLQFDVSVHHNYWYNCGSRITLTRQANVHFYNNYNYCDIRDKNAELSYITSLRANCYVFSEANYFEGCKNVFQVKNGYAKCYNNSYVACFGELYTGGAQEVTYRTDKISNTCKYGNIDYSSFDTDPNLFYYDQVNQKSDCYLTNSNVARVECITFAGSQYRTVANMAAAKTDKVNSNIVTPANPISFTDSLEATFPTSKGESVINNISYSISGVASGKIKFKDQGVTFKLSKKTTVSVAYDANTYGIYHGQIVRADGKVMLNGSGSVVLDAGVYYIESAAMDKETTLSSLIFEDYDENKYFNALKAEYNRLFALIPDNYEMTIECYNTIVRAVSAYNRLRPSDRESLVDPMIDLNMFISQYKNYVEGLIDAIGDVSLQEKDKIRLAQASYDLLMKFDSEATISNLNTLNEKYEQYVDLLPDYFVNCVSLIKIIGVSLNIRESIEEVMLIQYGLTEEQEQLDNVSQAISDLNSIIDEYNNLYEITMVNNQMILADLSDEESVRLAMEAYLSLDEESKNKLTATVKISNVKINYINNLINNIPTTLAGKDLAYLENIIDLYDSLESNEKSSIINYSKVLEAKEEVEELLNQAISWSFDGKYVSDSITYSGNTKTTEATFNGETFSKGLKMESKAGEITFTITSSKTLTIYQTGGSTLKINGNATAVSNVTEISLQAGTYTIKKGDGSAVVYAIFLQ